jgi:carbon monoxide dehydrogenase subunit G
MNIEGTYTLQASPEEVWHCLTDQQVLRRAMPGVERLEQENEAHYAVTMHIRQAPLIGLYQGHVTITDRHYPYQYRLSIEGEGRQSKISGEGVVQLSRHDENTVVSYKGTLNPGKLVTLLPHPLVQGAAKLLIQQFFTALAEHLRTMSRVETVTGTLTTSWDFSQRDMEGQKRPNFNGTTSERRSASPSDAPPQPQFARRVERETDNALVKPLWIERARRFGIIVALLALVWVGTQIPKRLLQGDH